MVKVIAWLGLVLLTHNVSLARKNHAMTYFKEKRTTDETKRTYTFCPRKRGNILSTEVKPTGLLVPEENHCKTGMCKITCNGLICHKTLVEPLLV